MNQPRHLIRKQDLRLPLLPIHRSLNTINSGKCYTTLTPERTTHEMMHHDIPDPLEGDEREQLKVLLDPIVRRAEEELIRRQRRDRHTSSSLAAQNRLLGLT